MSLAERNRRLSAWLLAHRGGSWAVLALAISLAATAVPASIVDDADSPATWVTVVLALLIVYGVVAAVMIPRLTRQPAHELLAVQWTMLLATFLLGGVGALLGAGIWLPGLGAVLALAAWPLCHARARQSAAGHT